MANTSDRPGDGVLIGDPSSPSPDRWRAQPTSFSHQQMSPPAGNAAFQPLSIQSISPWPPVCSATVDDDDDDGDGDSGSDGATPQLFFYTRHAPSPAWASTHSTHSFSFPPPPASASSTYASRAGVLSLPPPPPIYSTPPAALAWTPACSTYSLLPQPDPYLHSPPLAPGHPPGLPSTPPPYPPGLAAPPPRLPITLDPATTAQREPNSDDYYLQLIADGAYSSSPSGFPLADPPYHHHNLAPFAPAGQQGGPSWADDGQPATRLAGQSATGGRDLVDLTAATASGGADDDDFIEVPDDAPALPLLLPGETPTRSAPRPNHDHLTYTPNRNGSMPVTRKRGATAVAAESSSSAAPSAKRRRTSATTTTTTAAARSSRAAKPASSRSTPARATPVATSSAAKERRRSGFESDDDDDFEVIDLSNPEKPPAPEEPSQPEPKPDRSVRLSGYQCVICMDNVTALAVTYCGHLFCSECIHSSLNIDPTRKTCPVCRQKLEGPRSDGRPTSRAAKTYFHLELKLMPANRRGKRPANR